MSRRASNMPYPAPSPADTALDLACLSEYAHTLDSLPIDLSRSYGDLRELDAVLSASMTLLTGKVNELISMVESKSGTNDDRLYLLTEIAEEAARLKLGGEDKIRVACHAADGLRAHRSHLKALLEHMLDREFAKTSEALGRKTVYPHVTSRSYYPPGMAGEGGRRNRRVVGSAAAYGGLIANGGDASPGKRKRVVRDEDLDVTRTPSKKDRTEAPPGQRPRNGARAKKVANRANSPTESVLSAASLIPQSLPVQPTSSVSKPSGRTGNNSTSTKRTQGDGSSRRDPYSVQPPSASHPSLPVPFMPSQTSVHTEHHTSRAMSNGIVPEWPHGHLEGPGMPVVRNFHQVAGGGEGNEGTTSTGGEPDGDADDNQTYCFCDGVSYGEMIACDDEECEREWFHIACVGLTVVPDDTWYCSKCLEKRQNQKKPGRGGKKRAAGGRSAARNNAA